MKASGQLGGEFVRWVATATIARAPSVVLVLPAHTVDVAGADSSGAGVQEGGAGAGAGAAAAAAAAARKEAPKGFGMAGQGPLGADAVRPAAHPPPARAQPSYGTCIMAMERATAARETP